MRTTKTTSIGKRTLPCPHCGYDLRASPHTDTGVRCPECGTITPLAGKGALSASRVPWTQRRWRGFLPAFGWTLWLVLAQPGLLAREVEVPSRPRDARRFRLLCLALATVIATFSLMMATSEWKTAAWWVPPALRFPSIIPAAILQDHWYGAFPLAVGIFVAFWLCLDLYRAIVRLGGGPGPHGEPSYHRRRLATLSLYSAALLLVQSAFMSLVWVFWVYLTDQKTNHRPVDDAEFGTLSFLTLAAAIYLWASLPLVLRTGRWRALRALLMAVYPVVAYGLWLTVVTAINWAVGYVVLGIRSMTS